MCLFVDQFAVMAIPGLPPDLPLVFKVDKPFHFVIQYNTLQLFTGVISNL